VEEELNVLTSGCYFGEIGIIERKERTAAAYALEDCDLFCLDAKAFEFSFGVIKNIFNI
jgi:CRP-like cAMP-binding protein